MTILENTCSCLRTECMQKARAGKPAHSKPTFNIQAIVIITVGSVRSSLPNPAPMGDPFTFWIFTHPVVTKVTLNHFNMINAAEGQLNAAINYDMVERAHVPSCEHCLILISDHHNHHHSSPLPFIQSLLSLHRDKILCVDLTIFSSRKGLRNWLERARLPTFFSCSLSMLF